MAGRGTGPDFVEALARGLDILSCFDSRHPRMTLSEVADAAGLARPTARRLLLTLRELGYVRADGGLYALTPQVLRLGISYASALGLWDIARPHLEDLVAQTGESSSMSQLDGSDIVYVARVSVPKIITLRVEIGTRFPALHTSQGKVLLGALDAETLRHVLAEPSRSGLPPFLPRDRGRTARRTRPGVGSGRRGARAGRPLGGRARTRRHRDRTRGDERHRARGGDERRRARRRAPAAVAAYRRRGLGGVGSVAVAPACGGRRPVRRLTDHAP
jgi:DNA-binding IclR family transcriptional regulator